MTKIVNQDQKMTLFGDQTPRTVIYKSESHKLHQAFNVKAGEVILQGMPVAIDADGLLVAFKEGTTDIYLGIAITDNQNPAYQAQRSYPVEVTVMVEGYAICNWVSEAAGNAGYVIPTGNLLNGRFIIAKASADATNFIALTPADEANEVIQVLIK